ncbi:MULTISPECIES: chaplin [unclassified Streptomyces]|uniref:chaplin n=1 Tax=unclassified Streptomyces TaxID=2593676 RepID=UPI0028C39CA2|nr:MULTISPECIES: chaplin [unclassified Streptomyces]WNO63929.1 chaplin [Streptomyces sp. AM2-3-1]
MRQVTRKGLITMAAAGGVLALSGGYAHADAGATGDASNSPGVLSGNSIEIPVHVPVNACGNSVSVVGLLNPAAGNACGSGSGSDSGSATSSRHGSAAPASGSRASNHSAQDPSAVDLGPGTGKHRAVGSDSRNGATAEGYTQGSPGILSGNTVQAPIDIPVNACGNSITIGGLLSPSSGNSCENDPDVAPPPVRQVTPGKPTPPMGLTGFGVPSTPNAPEPQTVELAHTGAGGLDLLVPASAGLLLAGAGTVLYRRSRMSA